MGLDDIQVLDGRNQGVEVLGGQQQVKKAARALLHLVQQPDGVCRRGALAGEKLLDLGDALLVGVNLGLDALHAGVSLVVGGRGLLDLLLDLVD